MCTYVTEKAEMFGSAKGPQGWFKVDMANVYFDHPYHAPLEHSLNIDFVNEAEGSPTRASSCSSSSRSTCSSSSPAGRPSAATSRRPGGTA